MAEQWGKLLQVAPPPNVSPSHTVGSPKAVHGRIAVVVIAQAVARTWRRSAFTSLALTMPTGRLRRQSGTGEAAGRLGAHRSDTSQTPLPRWIRVLACGVWWRPIRYQPPRG